MLRFNVERFVADLGGPVPAAAICRVSRTTPYRWIKTGRINSDILERAKEAKPNLNLDDYFMN